MNITVVGGGTAGWIAAYYISKAQPGVHKISVVESSKIGIIGAGEGSTGSMVDLLNGSFFNYTSDIQNFIEMTDATPKMGIRHKNWGRQKESYFAPLDVSPTGFSFDDYIFKYVLHKYGKQKMHLASTIGLSYENNRYYDSYYAFHFDGHKVGEFFKTQCIKDGIKIYDSIVKEINIDTNGYIKSIVLDDGYLLQSDLFIDCTGFSRVIMKKLEVDWISKKEMLPMNTAIPFILNYSANEIVMPETGATALSSGWMWDIPLYSRRGCGYVFNDSFISEDQAVLEIESILNKKIEPIKVIKFDSGYSSYFWYKNCISLGLSSSFVEPLEATSIHNTIIQISLFVNEFLSKETYQTFIESKQNLYNKRIKMLMDLTVDFISLHYQGGRTDTDFWKYITYENIISDRSKEIVEQCKYRIPSYTILEGMYGSFSIPLANWILAGIDLISPEQALDELRVGNKIESSRDSYSQWTSSG
jgi:tryptophan halogenase